MARTVAHICILVHDIDEAIRRYANILGVVAPELLERKVVKQKRFAGDVAYITAFFGAVGDACDIQLLQPPDPQSPLYRRLEKHGEGVHHIAFSSAHLEDTYQQLKEKGVTVGDQLIPESTAETRQLDGRHFWILPQYSHGVLIEIIDDYKLANGILTK